ISSRWALSRCTWAAGGTISDNTLLTREPSSLISSITRSPSRLIAFALRAPREAHAQLAVLDRCARGLAARKHPRQRDLAAVVADGHVKIAVVAAQVDRRLVHERHL